MKYPFNFFFLLVRFFFQLPSASQKYNEKFRGHCEQSQIKRVDGQRRKSFCWKHYLRFLHLTPHT